MALEKNQSRNVCCGRHCSEEPPEQKKTRRLKSLIEKRACGVYPFVEGPVYFNFGDRYGDDLFLSLHKEYCCGLRDNNYGRPFVYDIRVPDVHPWTRDDIYTLSSLDHLIHLFIQENLL